ncbi:lycopene beta-cyclase CrtY [Caulobacter sp. S45]|uniref:lycopene beta-cyclase CrtY n=1 Tax=Caulobacter sp. S45 TaxID=1641861 RepID=UPI0020C6B1E0|nr:lycopene beta-cyclase CrtY [Caulobacter sp. S45]
MTSSPQTADVLLAGAGLANGLIALRLKATRPELRVVAFDQREPEVEDSHTWSFFSTDVPAPVRAWLEPMAAHRWDGYEVRFPGQRRRLTTAYASLTGAALHGVLEAALGEDFKLGRKIMSVSPGGVELEDGESWRGPLVIDGRGARRSAALTLAWQKFLGLELRLEQPHGLERPVIIDADVEQHDGFRFVYLLPFDATTMLVEDTYYSSGPRLDPAALEGRVLAYVAAKGWRVAEVVRREQGVLPIVLDGDMHALQSEGVAGVPMVGMRAALFHPVTGYSLPDAAILADLIAGAPQLTSAAVLSLVQARARRRWRESRFLRVLNRMLFLAADPPQRYKVLQRFYQLSQPLIERFYAGQPNRLDQARILIGRPPVPLGRALRALPSSSVHTRAKSTS